MSLFLPVFNAWKHRGGEILSDVVFGPFSVMGDFEDSEKVDHTSMWIWTKSQGSMAILQTRKMVRPA